mgnify:CR=1 FL=1
MRRLILISFLIISPHLAAQTPSIEHIRDNVISQFAQINDYQVDITISVKMTGFRMPKKKIRMYYKKPDKIKVETRGFAILPKIGVGGNPSVFLDMLKHVTEIKQTIRDNAVYFENPVEVPRHVVTMGIATVMGTRHCLLLVNGAKKADAVRRMIEGPVSASCPASILLMHPRVTIVLDEEAAYLLTFKEHYRWVDANKLDWQRYS